MKIKNLFAIGLSSILIGMFTGSLLASAAGANGLGLTGSDKSQSFTCEDTEYENSAWHEHGYRNDSEPSDKNESYLRIFKLRIYLDQNFVDNIDKSSLQCSTSTDYVSCDGGKSTEAVGDTEGGTKVTYNKNTSADDIYSDYASFPYYVEWEFGKETASAAPFLPGKNDTYSEFTNGAKASWTTGDRDMAETIAFTFKDGTKDATVKTQSAAYVKFWEYDTTCGTWSDYDKCWDSVIEDDTGTADYHWNVETTTNTTTFTCEGEGENKCEYMTITPNQKEVGVDNLYTDTDFEIKAFDKDGNDITKDLKDGYHYESSGEGEFKYGILSSGTDFVTPDSTTTYKNAGAGDSFTVEAVGWEDTCNVEIEFPYCKDLSITSPKSGVVLQDKYTTDITVKGPTASNGEVWPFDLTYTSDDSAATFDGSPTPYTTTSTKVSYSSSESAEVNVVADHDTKNLCNDSFSYTLIPPETKYCTNIDLTGPDSNNCWSYNVNSSGITPNVSAIGYTDETKTTVVPDVTVTPDDSSGVTGKICWPSYTKGNYLYVYVPGYTPMCEGDYLDTTPDVPPVTPPGGPGGGAPTGGGTTTTTTTTTVIVPVTPVTPIFGKNGVLDKYIYTFNFADQKDSRTDNNIFFSHDEDYAFYTLEYDPAGGEDSIVFNDQMWNANLSGYFGKGQTGSVGHVALADRAELEKYSYTKIRTLGLTEDLEVGSSAIGDSANSNRKYWIPYVSYDNGTKIEIKDCSTDPSNICYDPAYEPVTGGVVMNNVNLLSEDAVIRIRYVGRVYATPGLCDRTDDPCLTETFDNYGSVETGSQTVSANAKLVVLCSYLVTRNAGDVYLEQALPSGTDLACIDSSADSSYANVEGIIVQQDNASTTSDFCTDASSSSSFISNLSSYFCEIVSAVSNIWESTSIATETEQHVDEEIRNAETLQGLYPHSFSSWQDLKDILKNQNNPDSGILYFKGTPGAGDQITLSSNILVDSGAWTLIVEDADLVIKGNITYADTSVTQEIPSIGFVVLGGNIYIGSGAHVLSGVYFTDQGFDGDTRSAVNGQLEIYGSIYGDVSKLLQAANYVGSPNLDGGSIVVHYDSRILLSTPPGLGEYIDVNSEKAVN